VVSKLKKTAENAPQQLSISDRFQANWQNKNGITLDNEGPSQNLPRYGQNFTS